MKYRILIDATTIIEKKDGLSQYIISLLNNFPAAALEQYDILVLVNRGLQREEFWSVIKKRGYVTMEASIAPIGPKREWDMFWYLRKHRKDFDLFHSTSNQYPLALKRGIATIHDITFRKFLNTRRWTFNMAPRFLNLIIKNSLYRSSAVIAVSDYTKTDLINSFKLPQKIRNKIEVIHEGWEHLQEKDNEQTGNEISFQFESYLFYVGTTRLHKNMKNLLQAFRLVIGRLPKKINLVISGNETYLDEEDKKVLAIINKNGQRVFFTGFVSNAALAELFRKADAFIFPSLSEGFGIPVLEAFYFDIPLLCSNTTSLPEIAGDAALYFDPADSASIATIIEQFYREPALAETMIQKGRLRLDLFSWKQAAEHTVALYKKVLA